MFTLATRNFYEIMGRFHYLNETITFEEFVPVTQRQFSMILLSQGWVQGQTKKKPAIN
jgi:hypothetical protein